MRFVTNNVNVILMSTIVLLAIFGVAYYNYQEAKFQTVYMENERLEAEVAQLETNLTAQEDRLRNIFGELQEQLQDSVKFENLYSEVTSERDDLETDLGNLETDLQQEQNRRRLAEREVTALESEITRLTAERDSFRNQYFACQDDLEQCEKDLDFCS